MLASIDLGKILFNNNRDAKASNHIEIALMNASYIGDFHQTGRALDYMGYGYLRRDDYQNAYGAYQAAAEKYHVTIFTGFAERCKSNMDNIERKERNPDAVVGFYRPPVDIDQTLFYPPVWSFASELPISHS